jgi:hypothetical protein
MATELAATAVPPEIFQNIETLHGEVETLQRELAQALEVWQTTLADERKNFDEWREHKELAWQEQDTQWARQNQAYEERLAELNSEFEARLKQTEQNAARALAELDDSWQQDKLEWGPAAQAEWPAQRRQLETKAQALELELEALRARNRELEEQALVASAVPERQAGLPAGQAGPTPETVQALERQLLEFRQTVASLQDRASHSDELLNACVQALDYQISVLYDLVNSQLIS